jgi:methyl-accepting chemotaxis protein
MGTIVRQVRDATGRMAEISAASREQSMRAGQVTHAMSEINSGTQRNAGMVSQAAASTETLRNEARALMSSVSEFSQQQQHEPAAA